ncbi:hypothetical protein HPB48_022080 [Haemaphysalis longicornis]|uniref:Uncharacterized protein n=1 Tax=Haemaphysalis longicornis TaxID=44386 RepID=A0A9J6G031_HAELO|nr:hypothetical protein HPB48_022080 [Haemaphysalis longicornis]
MLLPPITCYEHLVAMRTAKKVDLERSVCEVTFLIALSSDNGHNFKSTRKAQAHWERSLTRHLKLTMLTVSRQERAGIVALFIHGVLLCGIAEQTGRPLSAIIGLARPSATGDGLKTLPRGHSQWATGSEEDLHIVAAAVDSPNITACEIKGTF